MGRKPTVNQNLPKNLRARKRGSQVYYYYDTGEKPRKEIPLGKDYVVAVRKWAEFEYQKIPKTAQPTFIHAAARYKTEVIPNKAPKTQQHNLSQLKKLLTFFGGENPAPLDEIQPEHIKQYLQWRKDAPIAANRELALFSHIWTMCSPAEWHYTDKVNPANGIKRNKEKPREMYIDDYLYDILYECADPEIKDAMDIAYLTGQRPADVLKIATHHIREDILYITQNKTGKKLRFAVTGKLAEIIKRRLPAATPYLIHSRGKAVSPKLLSLWFKKTRDKAIAEYPELTEELKHCQFRDLRAKSGTDSYLTGSMETAQERLGHTTQTMTRRYVRRDKILQPLDDFAEISEKLRK